MRRVLILLFVAGILPSCAEFEALSQRDDLAITAYRDRLHRKVDSIAALAAKKDSLAGDEWKMDGSAYSSSAKQMLENILLDLERREESLQQAVTQLEAQRGADKYRSDF